MNRNISEKLKILIFIISLILSQFVYAGITGKIAGRITDADDNVPLPGANVVIEGTLIGAASDMDGYYVILNISPGTYILKASMIGYESVTVKNVIVKIDLTTTIDVQMSTEVLGMEEVVVVAKRPLVAPDVAHSQLNIEAEKIKTMPVTDVTEIVGLQAGVQGLTIRGGSSRQTAFIVDGFIMNDERYNKPYTSVSLSTVDEVQVQTGGFNAEYGNVRSGVINIITNEGGRKRYSGNITFRYQPPGKKHFGPSVYDPDTYYTKPYLDPAVCFTGTKNGDWDAFTQKQYPSFEGWNSVSEATLQDNDPTNDLTPEGARRLYCWQHRRQGDIKKPDYVADVSFGGPAPFISEMLGNLRFYASYKDIREMLIVPLADSSYDENIARLKMTSNINPYMKLTFTGMYGEIHSSSRYQWTAVPTGDVLRSDYEIANLVSNGNNEVLYVPGWFSPSSIYRNIFGIKLNHVLSSKTFYEVILQNNINRYKTYEMALRDTTNRYEIVDGYFVDEAPYGYWAYGTGSLEGMRTGGWMNLGRENSVINTTSFRFDFVSQLNNKNQFKTGLKLVYNDYDIRSYTSNRNPEGKTVMDTWNREQVYRVYPFRIGAYVQDKLEFEGFIANLGVRFDLSDANVDWFDLDRYDEYYEQGSGKLIEKEVPVKKAETQWCFSPRINVSHPITVDSKLYFNYGHYYTEPSSTYRFRLQRENNGLVTSIGNPGMAMEKTVSYELGYSHNLFDQFLLNISAYYKDVTNQSGSIYYENIFSTAKYYKYDNNNYEDIRGFEFTFDKRIGDWVTGFLNYTYMVRTYGYFGYTKYYEDPNKMRDYLRMNPTITRPYPTPYMRANIDFHTPLIYGPTVMGLYPIGGWNLNLLANWNAGRYTTYNPENIPGLINNVQWKDTYNLNLRLSKTFKFDKFSLRFFADFSNVFNTKFLSYAGFSDSYDYGYYMESLHFDWEEGIQDGDDRVGEYRKDGVDFVPMKNIEYSVTDLQDLELNINLDENGVYYYEGYPIIGVETDQSGSISYVYDKSNTIKEYYGYANGEWVEMNKSKVNDLLEDKAYIDNPNLEYFRFLNPRQIKLGITITF